MASGCGPVPARRNEAPKRVSGLVRPPLTAFRLVSRPTADLQGFPWPTGVGIDSLPKEALASFPGWAVIPATGRAGSRGVRPPQPRRRWAIGPCQVSTRPPTGPGRHPRAPPGLRQRPGGGVWGLMRGLQWAAAAGARTLTRARVPCPVARHYTLSCGRRGGDPLGEPKLGSTPGARQGDGDSRAVLRMSAQVASLGYVPCLLAR